MTKTHLVKEKLRTYISLVENHSLRVIVLVFTTVVSTVLFNIIAPLQLADIILWLATPHSSDLTPIISKLTFFAVTIFLSDVIGWRITDHLHWTLEAKIVRDINSRRSLHHRPKEWSAVTKSRNDYVTFADATVYTAIPLIVSVIGYVAVISFFSLHAASYFVIATGVVIAITIALVKRWSKAEKRHDSLEKALEHSLKDGDSSNDTQDVNHSVYKSLLDLNWRHDTKQAILKIALLVYLIFGIAVVVYVASSHQANSLLAIATVIYLQAATRQLFHFGNRIVATYTKLLS